MMLALRASHQATRLLAALLCLYSTIVVVAPGRAESSVNPNDLFSGLTAPEVTAGPNLTGLPIRPTDKVVDITRDLMRHGLNREIDLSKYLDGRSSLKFQVNDMDDVPPFTRVLSPTRTVYFVTDNDMFKRWCKDRKKSVLSLATRVDLHDFIWMHFLMVKLSYVLDKSEKSRFRFLRKLREKILENSRDYEYLTVERLNREVEETRQILIEDNVIG